MSTKLAKSAHEALERRGVDPKVNSKHEPSVDWLMEARAALNSDETLQALFKQVQDEGHDDDWLTDALAIRLNIRWGGQHIEEAEAAAGYLVDEYNQLGEGIHLVSTETGKVAVTLSDADIYQPAPVPREHGGLAVPLPRIRPDLEAAIVTWTFDRAREERIVATLAERGHQTALLRAEGDPRLLPATRKGRSEIVRSLTDFTPKALLDGLGGTSAAFLRHFDIRTDPPTPDELEGYYGPIEGDVSAVSVMGIQDQTTINISHSRQATLRGVLPQGWARAIAAELTNHLCPGFASGKPVGSLTKDDVAGARFWVAPPELVGPLHRLGQRLTIMPAERACGCVGFRKDKVGIIQVPEAFEAESHELFERWEAVANLTYVMWIKGDTAFEVLLVRGEHQATVESRFP